MKRYTPMSHQTAFSWFWYYNDKVLNFDACGTGKTLSVIHTVKTHWEDARVLVLCPLSIMRPAWAGDLDKFWPECDYGLAYVAKRSRVFNNDHKWVISNHDSIKQIVAEGWHKMFDILVIDEADVYRNRTTARTKAMLIAARHFDRITLMTGTPTPKSVTDVWSLAFAIDGGERLGKNFFQFRNQVQDSQPILNAPSPHARTWTDKPDAVHQVATQLSDITTRIKLDDVVELPETITRTITIDMPAKLRRMYEQQKRESIMFLESGHAIDAVHAGARRQKLMQLCSGGVYDNDKVPIDIHKDRHQLVLDLVEESKQALVAFNWDHQVNGLTKEAKKRGIEYGVINGKTPVKERSLLVSKFQKGKLRVLFCHPQSAGHGLTLTNANRVIWASPTDRADLYVQFNHRMRRKGLKHKSEIIHIEAEQSVEQLAYDATMGKKCRQDDLLGLFTHIMPQTA